MAQPNTNPITMVTMTQLRRNLADLAEMAAKGETVVITKSGIPFMQLIPVRHEYQAPTTDPINLGDLATATTDELMPMLTQARQHGDEALALAILAELGERMVRKHTAAAAMTHLQEG